MPLAGGAGAGGAEGAEGAEGGPVGVRRAGGGVPAVAAGLAVEAAAGNPWGSPDPDSGRAVGVTLRARRILSEL